MKRSLFSIMALLLATQMFFSCATRTKIEYRDRDVVKYVNQVVHDTLTESDKDSVFVEVKTKGDTVFVNKYKFAYKYRNKIVEKHDTCFRDSVVTEIKQETKVVEKIPFKMYLALAIVCVLWFLSVTYIIKK